MSTFKTSYLVALSILLNFSLAQANEFHLEAVCSVNETDATGTNTKSLLSNKTLNIEIGSGSTGAQSIGLFQGLEFRMLSPMTISAPYVLVEAKTSQQKIQAGRDIGGTNGNLIVLAVPSPVGGTLSATCNVTIQ